MTRCALLLGLAIVMLTSACRAEEPSDTPLGDEPAAATEVSAQETSLPPTELAPTEPPTTEPAAGDADAGPSGSAVDTATYRDETYGFAFDHPADWTVEGDTEVQARGEITQLASNGEVRLSIVVLRWDPVGDLDAYIETRKTAWESSQLELPSEERSMDGGFDGASFVVRGTDGSSARMHFAVVGDRYLSLSGQDEPAVRAAIELRKIDTPSGAGADAADDRPAGDDLAGIDCRTSDTASLDWTVCNVIDGLRSRNTQPLPGYMSDAFALAYWQSEGLFAQTPEEVLTELTETRLPADPSAPLTFSARPEDLPDLMGTDPAALLGPDVEISLIVFGTGWGEDGADEVLLLFSEDEPGTFRWRGVLYALGGFER